MTAARPVAKPAGEVREQEAPAMGIRTARARSAVHRARNPAARSGIPSKGPDSAASDTERRARVRRRAPRALGEAPVPEGARAAVASL